MKVDLKESKENSKLKLGWKSNKEPWQGKDKFGGQNTNGLKGGWGQGKNLII